MAFSGTELETKICDCGGTIKSFAQGENDVGGVTFTWESWYSCDKCGRVQTINSGREYGKLKPRPTTEQFKK